MIRNILNSFGTTLYVQIWENRIKVIDIKSNKVFDEKPLLETIKGKNGKSEVIAFGNKANIKSTNPFSHPRVLFSDFHIGEKLLQLIIHKLLGTSVFTPSPAVIIHPMEKIEGGLTMIESRAFKEMAAGAGARQVVVYEGEVLEPSKIDIDELSKEYNKW